MTYEIRSCADGRVAVMQVQRVEVATFADESLARLFVAAMGQGEAKPGLAVDDVSAEDPAPNPRGSRQDGAASARRADATSCASFTAEERDAFLRAIVAGERPYDVATRMGRSKESVRGYLSGAAVRARRQEIEAECADQKTSLPAVRPTKAVVVNDRDPDGPLGRPPVRYGLPSSSAAETACNECGARFMATDAQSVDPRCARCRVGS